MKCFFKVLFNVRFIVLLGMISSLFYVSLSTACTFILFSFLCAPVMAFMMIQSEQLCQHVATALRKQHVVYYYGVVFSLFILCLVLSRGLSNISLYLVVLYLTGLMLFFMLQRAWLSTGHSIKRFVVTSGCITLIFLMSLDGFVNVLCYIFSIPITVSILISYTTLSICFWRLSPGYQFKHLARADR